MGTPWNEIHPKKHLFQSISVVPLFQNSCNLRYAIPLGIFNLNMRFFRPIYTKLPGKPVDAS